MIDNLIHLSLVVKDTMGDPTMSDKVLWSHKSLSDNLIHTNWRDAALAYMSDWGFVSNTEIKSFTINGYAPIEVEPEEVTNEVMEFTLNFLKENCGLPAIGIYDVAPTSKMQEAAKEFVKIAISEYAPNSYVKVCEREITIRREKGAIYYSAEGEEDILVSQGCEEAIISVLEAPHLYFKDGQGVASLALGRIATCVEKKGFHIDEILLALVNLRRAGLISYFEEIPSVKAYVLHPNELKKWRQKGIELL
jgi:hypothetical protein